LFTVSVLQRRKPTPFSTEDLNPRDDKNASALQLEKIGVLALELADPILPALLAAIFWHLAYVMFRLNMSTEDTQFKG